MNIINFDLALRSLPLKKQQSFSTFPHGGGERGSESVHGRCKETMVRKHKKIIISQLAVQK